MNNNEQNSSQLEVSISTYESFPEDLKLRLKDIKFDAAEVLEKSEIFKKNYQKNEIDTLISNNIKSMNSAEEVLEGIGGGDFSFPVSPRSAFVQLISQTKLLLDGKFVNITNTDELFNFLNEIHHLAINACHKTYEEMNDLNLQIKSANKKLNENKQFLEDQTLERENERDEAQHRIENLEGQVSNFRQENLRLEVEIKKQHENYEQQLKELNEKILNNEKCLETLNKDLKDLETENVFLKDIINDFQDKFQIAEETIAEFNLQIEQLKEQLLNQSQDNIHHNCDKCHENEKLTIVDVAFHAQHLQNELNKFESFGKIENLEYIQVQLQTIESLLIKSTNELEKIVLDNNLDINESTTDFRLCFSPTEDVSINEKGSINKTNKDLPTLVNQIIHFFPKRAQIIQKIIKSYNDMKHSMIRLNEKLKNLEAEKNELMSKHVDQTDEISSLKICLDEYKFNLNEVDNTKYENRIVSLENELKQLKNQISLIRKEKVELFNELERNKEYLKEAEHNLNLYENLQETIDSFEYVKKFLSKFPTVNCYLSNLSKGKLTVLPDILEIILNEKDSEIKSLKEKLKLIETHSCYNSTNRENESTQTLSSNSLYSNEPIYRRTIPEEPELESLFNEKFNVTFEQKNTENELNFTKVNGHSTINLPKPSKNQEQNVIRVDFANDNLIVGIIDENNQMKTQIDELMSKLEKLQTNLNATETSLLKLKNENEELKLKFENLFVERERLLEQLNELKTIRDIDITERDREINNLKSDVNRFSEMYIDIVRENKTLQTRNEEKQNELNEIQKKLNTLLNDIVKYQNQISNLEEEKRQVQKSNEQIIIEKDNQIEKLIKLINDKVPEIDFKLKIRNFEETIQNLTGQIIEMESVIKKCEMQIRFYEEAVKEKDTLIKNKQNEIDQLQIELCNKQDLLIDKEKMIDIMSKDGELIHEELSKVQQKIHESGNLIELKQNLKREQDLNSALNEEIEILRSKTNDSSIQLTKMNILENINQLSEKLNLEQSHCCELNEKNQKLEEKLNQLMNEDSELFEKFRNRLVHLTETNETQLKTIENLKFDLNAKEQQLREILEKFNGQLQIINCLNTKLVNSTKIAQLSDLCRINDLVKTNARLLENAKFKNELFCTTNKLCVEVYREQLINQAVDEFQDLNGFLNQFKSKFDNNEFAQLEEQLNNVLSKFLKLFTNLNNVISKFRLYNEELQQMLEEKLDKHLQDSLAYGKYLRSESYRKALVFQKELHMYGDLNIVRVIQKKSRFKIVVLVIISIFRMKYLVNYWRTGPRSLGTYWYRYKQLKRKNVS